MVKWLAPILGVVVVGVIIELVSKESRLGKFIRSIYAFFVLFVIVQPLPGLFNKLDFFNDNKIEVNAGLVDDINSVGKEAKIKLALYQMGYKDALVYVSGNEVYITIGQDVTSEEITKIKDKIGVEGAYIL